MPLEDWDDWKHFKHAGSAATGVTILDRYGSQTRDPVTEPPNGVAGRIGVLFRTRGYERLAQFNAETIASTVAVLKAFPKADLYLKAYVDLPALIRKGGQLTLASRLVEDEFLSEKYPYMALFDMPYTVAPLGPW